MLLIEPVLSQGPTQMLLSRPCLVTDPLDGSCINHTWERFRWLRDALALDLIGSDPQERPDSIRSGSVLDKVVPESSKAGIFPEEPPHDLLHGSRPCFRGVPGSGP